MAARIRANPVFGIRFGNRRAQQFLQIDGLRMVRRQLFDKRARLTGHSAAEFYPLPAMRQGQAPHRPRDAANYFSEKPKTNCSGGL
jgi:hypothetical protein